MKTRLSSRTRAGKTGLTCVATLAWLACPPLWAQETAKPEDPKKEEKKEETKTDDADLRNWIEVSLGGNFVHGDKAAFQQRTNQPRDLWGGVTDFHYEMDVGKKGLFEVDGRGIFDAHNYSITLGLKDPDRGYFKTGFEQFRTYYDLSGGYFPGNGQFFELYPDVGEVDRTHVFFEAGLTLPNKPQFRVRYDYDAREGDKNSTIWGNTGQTGGAGTRNIVPTLNQVDEDRHSIALDLSHTIGNTEAGLGGRYSFSSYDNSRYMRRNPGEASNRYLTHREGVDTDLFSVHAFTDTDFTTKWKLTTGYAFTKLDTDLSGDRAIGGSFNVSPLPPALGAFPGRQNRDHGFYGLTGGTAVDQHVASISVMYRPTPNITIVPSLRIESQTQDGVSTFTDVEVDSTFAVLTEDVRNTRQRDFLDVTESLEARYTGITNIVLYTRAELLEGSGDLRETERGLEDGAPYDINRDTHSSRFTQKYSIGANWYPLRRLNIAAQYYHKIRENDYDLVGDNSTSSAGLYPAFIEYQRFNTDDANIRVTLRPHANVTTVTRYDFQYSTFNNDMQNLPEVEGGRSTAHIITESVTWMATSRLYFQVSGSYTLDQLSSPANDIFGRLQVAENNYLTATATVGYALTEKTDLTANYGYFLADNYEPGIAPTGLPLGAGLEEHLVGATVVHRFSKRLQLTARYAFMTSHDDLSGGHDDFDAHLVSTSLRFRF